MILRTGRLLNHDPQSWNYEHARQLILPKSITHRCDAPALNQKNVGACTGFAAAQWLNCRIAVNNRKRYRRVIQNSKYTANVDGLLLYRGATLEDEFPWTYPPSDRGSSGLGAAKALKRYGAIERYEHTFSFAGFLAALQAQPVLVGTVWPNSMFDPDRNGIIEVTGSLDGVGGHEYLAIGMNWPKQLIRIRNSWSSDWGIKGDAFIRFVDMDCLLAAQGDCTVPIVIGRDM